MSGYTFSTRLSPQLVIEFLYGADPPKLSGEEIRSIEQMTREVIRLDRATRALENARELIKQDLVAKLGDGVRYLHYRSRKGRDWKVSLYLNTSFDPRLVRARLRDHPEILSQCLTTGTTFRVTLPADPKNRSDVISEFVALIEQRGGVVTPYKYSPLGPLLRDELLVRLCREEQIDLSDTRFTRITAKIVEE